MDLIKNFKKYRRIIALTLAPIVLLAVFQIYQKAKVNEVYAVNPLIVTYTGGPPPNPMFNVTNMLPGDEEEKTFNVQNDSPDPVDVEMTSIKTDEEKAFAQILDVEITDLSTLSTIFSGKLQDFFDSPPINLGTFPAGIDKDFRVKVKFPTSAGNEYQNALVIFDIIWRTVLPPIDVPDECSHLANIIVNVVEGTEGNDNIHATSQSDLILAKGGDDTIDASSSSDCIVAGPGNDEVDAESGDDVVLGGEGNDEISTGSGNDRVYAGDGHDEVDTGSGGDLVYAGEGNDDIETGSGEDEVYGGPGEDYIRGGSDNDILHGEGGNDRIKGNSGDDFLDGGADIDDLNGNSGTDTCQNGELLNSCEL